MPTITMSFTLDSEADRDLMLLMAQLPKRQRSATIRRALREYLGGGRVTLGDIYQVVKSLERRLQSGVVVAGGGGNNEDDQWDEPADLVAALNALANR